ncbi:MAG: arylsulfatase [Prolixibacteraceae bacterium]|jgi:arylsulfatase A-like enzyme|nr:arylsulfatase [Prolixibacteraceae bacterium]
MELKKSAIWTLFLFSLGIVSTGTNTCTKQTTTSMVNNKVDKPNIIYILADDLGYGDLSCYGQKKFNTPNIDKLASEGMLFTRHYAGCTVCAPSRSSLLTGKDTGHTPIRGNKDFGEEGQWPLKSEAFTIAEMLKMEGYTTGCFGKWGLGSPGSEGDPNNQGFDEFYGFNCHNLSHNYYPDHLWKNHQKVILEKNENNQIGQYAPELIHQQAIDFIDKNRSTPFFLYYASTIPHAELIAPEEELIKFRNRYLPEKIFKGAKPGDEKFRKIAYSSQAEPHAAFAAMVSILDRQVGEVLSKLKELNIDKNTIIIFTSDNGPHLEGGADPDYFDSNGPFKGYKRDVYEGGIRVPMIARWPGKIKKGSKSDIPSAFWDVMPTFAEITGLTIPTDIQGISFLPTLLDKKGQKMHNYLYWEFHEMGGRQALQKDNWKLVRQNVLDSSITTTELYNLSTDQGEEDNVASQNPEKVQELLKLMNKARKASTDFQFIEKESF